MSAIEVAAFLAVGAAGAAVVGARDPLHRAIVLAFFGQTVGVLFLVLQAPDVGLSALVVGAIALPLMTVLVLAKTRSDEEDAEGATGAEGPG